VPLAGSSAGIALAVSVQKYRKQVDMYGKNSFFTIMNIIKCGKKNIYHWKKLKAIIEFEGKHL
jgi:hypothetical protein